MGHLTSLGRHSWMIAGTNAADFDDEDGGGLSLNARSRAILMQKLDRIDHIGTSSSVAESLGMTGFNGTVVSQSAPVLPLNGLPIVPANLYAQHPYINGPSGLPSECLLFRDMFHPTIENDPEFDLDIKEEVEEECTKFGTVKHIFVDKCIPYRLKIDEQCNGDIYQKLEVLVISS